jgi:hypothetical protein
MSKTFIEESKEFHDAVVKLFMVICEELGIVKLLDWLNKQLKKIS